MKRIVLDTNVLLSGIFSAQGPPGQILTRVRQKEFELVFSHQTLAEVLRIIERPRLQAYMKKRSLSAEEVSGFIKRLARFSVMTPGKLEIDAIPADPSDNKFLVCAVEACAEFIVSGDHHLIDLKCYQGIPIVTPAEFLDICRSS